MYKFSKIAFNLSLSFSLIFTAFITAQEVEEVVVTATKQEKSVQDIPVSIEAFTSEDIDKNMIDDFSYGGGITDDTFLATWADEYGITFPVVGEYNSATLSGLNTSGLFEGGVPFMILIDQEMKIVGAWTGGGSEAAIEAIIEEIMGE